MTQTETLELLVATLQQANSSQSESFVIPVLNNTKIQKSNRIIKVSPAVFQYCMSLFRNAFRRLSLLEGSSLIPSTIRTRSRHCIGYDLLSLS